MSDVEVIKSSWLYRLSPSSNTSRSSNMNTPTKLRRAKRWSKEEVQSLVVGIAKYRSQLFGVFSPERTLRDKRRAWDEITNMVNAVNISGTPRTVAQVEHKWYDIKCMAKTRYKEYSNSPGKETTRTCQPPTEIDRRIYRIMAKLGKNPEGWSGFSHVEEWLSQTTVTTIDDDVTEEGGDDLTSVDMNEQSITGTDNPLFFANSPASVSRGSVRSSSVGSSSRAKETAQQQDNSDWKKGDIDVFDHKKIRELTKVKAEVIQDPDIIPQVRDVYSKHESSNAEFGSHSKLSRLMAKNTTTTESDSSEDSEETAKPLRKRRRKSSLHRSKNNSDGKIEEILNLLKDKPKNTTEMCEDDMFMTSMTTALKKIEPNRRFKVKMGIMKLIHDAVMEDGDK